MSRTIDIMIYCNRPSEEYHALFCPLHPRRAPAILVLAFFDPVGPSRLYSPGQHDGQRQRRQHRQPLRDELTGASVTGVSGGPKLYTVSVNTGSGSGRLRLDVLDDSIADSASNPLGGSGPANGNFSTGEFYTIDKSAPTAGSLVAPNVTVSGGTTYSFTVTFSGNLAIDSTSLCAGDIRVSGPGGFNQLAILVGMTTAGNARTAIYQITAPGGSWDSADGGTYTVALEADQVFDSAGNSVGAGSLGSFLVRLNYTIYLPLLQR
jgi:hypothetical protein